MAVMLMEEITVEMPEYLLLEFENMVMKQYGKTAEEILVEFVKWITNSPKEAKEWLLKYT